MFKFLYENLYNLHYAYICQVLKKKKKKTKQNKKTKKSSSTYHNMPTFSNTPQTSSPQYRQINRAARNILPQVRLTVLPSINGTNTTTSHGGMLEVERTFKTVDQSQKEYEMEKTSASASTTRNQTARPHQARPLAGTVLLNRRPIRNTLAGGSAPSNTAVLAAVGAGMLPATMAMMIPMMLGKRRRRRRRSVDGEEVVRYLRVPKEVLEAQRRMGM